MGSWKTASSADHRHSEPAARRVLSGFAPTFAAAVFWLQYPKKVLPIRSLHFGRMTSSKASTPPHWLGCCAPRSRLTTWRLGLGTQQGSHDIPLNRCTFGRQLRQSIPNHARLSTRCATEWFVVGLRTATSLSSISSNQETFCFSMEHTGSLQLGYERVLFGGDAPSETGHHHSGSRHSHPVGL